MMEQETVLARLQENLHSVQQRIADAAAKSGRSQDEVTLVAVTKYVDASVTEAMFRCGQIQLGESRPQVLWDKADALAGCNVQWHLIGHLQRNKVKRTVPHCHLIQSVDSLRLLRTINSAAEELNLVTNCLLEVNVSREEAKHGFAAAELETVLSAAAELDFIRITGLMAMASLHGDAGKNRLEFAELRELKDRLQGFTADNIQLRELSMGMSRDFEAAIEEGATLVRIGSVLFEGVRA